METVMAGVKSLRSTPPCRRSSTLHAPCLDDHDVATKILDRTSASFGIIAFSNSDKFLEYDFSGGVDNNRMSAYK